MLLRASVDYRMQSDGYYSRHLKHVHDLESPVKEFTLCALHRKSKQYELETFGKSVISRLMMHSINLQSVLLAADLFFLHTEKSRRFCYRHFQHRCFY